MGHAELQPEDIDETITPIYAALKRTWIDFCRTTSIHGLKFTRDDRSNRIIRLVWYLITIVMFICAIVMVFTFYIDYRSNPTRMNVENGISPVSNLYFPTITLCPTVLYNMEKSKAYLQTLKLPENIQINTILESLTISNGFFTDDNTYDMTSIELMESVMKLNNISFVRFVMNLRWTCKDLIYRCRYQRNLIDCDELFTVSRAFYGHCCSFNMIQEGLNFTAKYSSSGIYEGLSLILYYNDSMFNQIGTYSHGFHLLINENAAFPSAHSVAQFIPLNEEIFISIHPQEIFCSNAVRSLDWENRLCVLNDEFPLDFFSAYWNGHCELNCRVTNMMKYCGCITFFFHERRMKEPVCTFKNIPCLVENFSMSPKMLLTYLLGLIFFVVVAQIIGRFRNTQCTCPMRCEGIDYEVQSTNAPIRLDAPTIDAFYNGIQKDQGIVHLFMGDQVYRRIRRDLLSNMVTLVSNLGSAFSLFVGMSMVSAVEIIYYFTVILSKYYKEEIKARKKLILKKRAKLEIHMEK